MDAFTQIGEKKSIDEIAHEWRAKRSGSLPTGDTTANMSFDATLRNILLCANLLQTTSTLISLGVRTLQPCTNDQIIEMAEALGNAIHDVVSVKSHLESLLSLRDKVAVDVLEALQKYLDVISEEHPRRRGAIHLIIKLAHRSEQLPRSLYVEDITLPENASYECGGFGDVYQGALAEQPIAVKKPRLVGGDAFARKRLCREALVWRQLRHPNVLLFIGLNSHLFPGNALPALISPWMKHGSLKKYMEQPSHRTLASVLQLMCGIADGLTYLHSLSITHGDINHMNILIDDQQCPQLADFGLVRLGDSGTLGGFTGTTNGFTVRWASPQRMEEHMRVLSDDVYSYGCVSYYMHSGLVPFEGLTEVRTILLVVQGHRPERPSSTTAGVVEPSDRIWDIITRCWDQDADRRPQMAEISEAIRDIMVVAHGHELPEALGKPVQEEEHIIENRQNVEPILQMPPRVPPRRLSIDTRITTSLHNAFKRVLSLFQKRALSADDIHTLEDLKTYRRRYGGREGHIDESVLTPAQRSQIGAILWAEMQAHPEQLERVKRDCPDLTDDDIMAACGVSPVTNSSQEATGRASGSNSTRSYSNSTMAASSSTSSNSTRDRVDT